MNVFDIKKYLLLFLLFIFYSQNIYSAKIKDLVSIKGVRDNPLIGYGLVIGLNGTGDSNSNVANASLSRMFSSLGINLQQEVTSKNVATVIVTAKLPSFARLGSRLDITVSSVGSAASLGGGNLLMTPLKAADGHVYAVASGAVSIGGIKKGRGKYATVGVVSGGAIVEKEIQLDFNKKKLIRLNIHNLDFTTAARIEKVINSNLGGKFAIASDAATIDIVVPPHYHRRVVPLISIIENFEVSPGNKAKVIINERTGTIVAGGDVLLRNVAISHGNLTIEINDTLDEGRSVSSVQGSAEKNKSKGSIYLMEDKTSLSNLIKALNSLGAKPDDIISIFQTLKKNGAISGEVEFI